VAWYRDNASGGTKAVGTKAANELGIYDMTGNVWELVFDADGSSRFMRGASWDNYSNICRVTDLAWASLSGRYAFIGFRLARSPVFTGLVTTFAGTGVAGGVNGNATVSSFDRPAGLAFDSIGNIYIGEYGGHRIRKITPAGVVTTFAGSGTPGATDGTGVAASFNQPEGIVVDSSGNLYVADTNNNKIRKITASGVVTTLAGSGTIGAADGTGASATFNRPFDLALDAAGNVYVGDCNNNKIRKITPAGVVTTLAGSGSPGATDATGSAASFNGTRGLVVDSSGNVYVADILSHKIRKITPSGVVSSYAGSGTRGSVDGVGTAATFNEPSALALDSAGNLYVGETGGHKIRKITPAGVVTTLAGSGATGSSNGTGSAASFNGPYALDVDPSGTLYVADTENHLIRKIVIQEK
jgi:sugar lactone lactonase YvrE